VGRLGEDAVARSNREGRRGRYQARAAFSLAHGIDVSGLEQSERVLATSLMLCAFFEKRLQGEGGKPLTLLFGPFWETVESYDESFDTVDLEGQWCAPSSWGTRARDDGTGNALALLRYRVNRLSRLLSVCDCWGSNVGSHLALWLDSHMHLVVACESRRSGPTRGDSARCTDLRMCDWRFVPDDVIVALRLTLGGNGAVDNGRISKMAGLYARVLSNMSICKTLSNVLKPLKTHETIKMCVCAAVTRCILGITTNKASFETRKAVHKMLDVGLDDFYDMTVKAAAEHARPVVFMCLREHAMHCVGEDTSLSVFLQTVPKWKVYAANVTATMDSLRVGLNSLSTPLPNVPLIGLISTIADDRFVCFARNAKRVPGMVSREGSKCVNITEFCKTMKRARDRSRDEKAIATENFSDPSGVGAAGLTRFNEMRTGENFDWEYISMILKERGGSPSDWKAAEDAFVQIISVMKQGVASVRALFVAESLKSTSAPFSTGFSVAGDCMQLIRTAGSVRKYTLPHIYTNMQRAAITKRFSDTTCSERDRIARASHLIWCVGCGTIKNFVVGGGKKNENSHASHGYKRICHDGDDLKCDERRLYECCKRVPLKRMALLEDVDADASQPTQKVQSLKSYCVDVFGVAYVVTTCCGRIATFDSLRCTKTSALMCDRCIKAGDIAAQAGPMVRVCHFCEQPVLRKKGCFTGRFIDVNDKSTLLTFCKRHTRHFMKRENEPMILAEVMAAIPRR
jgi:hypothetical protein